MHFIMSNRERSCYHSALLFLLPFELGVKGEKKLRYFSYIERKLYMFMKKSIRSEAKPAYVTDV